MTPYEVWPSLPQLLYLWILLGVSVFSKHVLKHCSHDLSLTSTADEDCQTYQTMQLVENLDGRHIATTIDFSVLDIGSAAALVNSLKVLV